MGISTHKTEWKLCFVLFCFVFYIELSLNLALKCQGYGHQRRNKRGKFFFNIQNGQYGTEGGLRKNLGTRAAHHGKFLNVMMGCYLERQNTCFPTHGTFPTPLTHFILSL